MTRLLYDIQLYDGFTREAITHDGKFAVCVAGSAKLEQIYNATTGDIVAVSTTHTQDIVDGKISFKTLASVDKVDIYIYTDRGYAIQARNVTPGGTKELYIDLQNHNQTLVIPFHFDNYTAGTMDLTGFFEIPGVLYAISSAGVVVRGVHAARTIDFGNAADADGIIAAASVATIGFVQLAGALGSGVRYVGAASQEFRTTVSAGANPTARGFIVLPSLIPTIF